MAFLAPSLVQLRNETNARWPRRDKTSDGWIGDKKHQARKSEHNPDAKGCVHALDIDKDGIDPAQVVSALVRDPRTWYVIWNRRIYARSRGFAPRVYRGKNPHTQHLHVSILLTRTAETTVSPWFRRDVTHPGPVVPRYRGRPLQFRDRPGWQLMRGSDVRTWQARMSTLRFEIDVDGLYGPQSERVARAFQRRARLVVDGVVGPRTWAAAWA
jgi:hypothetical protein